MSANLVPELKLRVDTYQEDPYWLNSTVVELKRGEIGNKETLKRALIPEDVKLNAAAIQCLNRCITQADILTFAFRIDDTIIRACKLKGSFYLESLNGISPLTCYWSDYRQGVDFDRPCTTEIVAATPMPMSDIFMRSNLTALAYQCDGSAFIHVYNCLPNQEKSIPPTWFLPEEERENPLLPKEENEKGKVDLTKGKGE